MLPDPNSRLSAHTNVWTEKCEESFEIRMLKIMQTTCIACPDIKKLKMSYVILFLFAPPSPSLSRISTAPFMNTVNVNKVGEYK